VGERQDEEFSPDPINISKSEAASICYRNCSSAAQISEKYYRLDEKFEIFGINLFLTFFTTFFLDFKRFRLQGSGSGFR